MSKTVVRSWNDFDPLEHVIVGRADFTCIPPSEPATEAKIPEDSDMRGMWGPRPLETVEKANAELDHLVTLLERRGVRVDRPTPIQWNQAVVTPDFMTGSSFGCMPPRDVLLTVGKEILSAPMSFRLPLLGIPRLPPAHATLLRRRPGIPLGAGAAPASHRSVLSVGLFRRDHHRGAPGAHRRARLRHHRARTAVRRGRHPAHRQGPLLPARADHEPSRDGVAATPLPRSSGARGQFSRRPVSDPHRRDVRAAATRAHHQQPETPAARGSARDIRGQRLGGSWMLPPLPTISRRRCATRACGCR